MLNTKTLKPVASRPPAERKALASKAGRASGRRRRELKAAREVMRNLLALPLKDFEIFDSSQSDVGKWLDAQGVKDKDQTQLAALCYALHRQALRGNLKAIEMSLKIAGEWPAEKSEVTTTVVEPEAETHYNFEALTYEQANELIDKCFETEKKLKLIGQ